MRVIHGPCSGEVSVHDHDRGAPLSQAHAAAAEQARASATEDSARLRADWVAACAERDANIAAVAELRAELSRYRDATGKTAEVLEEEKARAADLTSKHRAQVSPSSHADLNYAQASDPVRALKIPCCTGDDARIVLHHLHACTGRTTAEIQAELVWQ
jgi:hypothetical protein